MKAVFGAAWVIAGIAANAPAVAERFENTYIRFAMPEHWNCKQESSTFICQPMAQLHQKIGTILILTAKVPGPHDSMADYWKVLSGNPGPGRGTTLVEGPSYTRIGSTLWVSATHLGSELAGYFTTYESTVQNGVAILVTFSAHQAQYAESKALFLPVLATLEVKSR